MTAMGNPEIAPIMPHTAPLTGSGTGKRGGQVGRYHRLRHAQGVLTPHGTKHHRIGQVGIDFESADTAFGEVYFQAFHRIAEEAIGPADLFVAGSYVHRYERRAGTWKIARRSELVDWVRTEPAADHLLPLQPGFPMGARAPDDLSCRRDEMRVR